MTHIILFIKFVYNTIFYLLISEFLNKLNDINNIKKKIEYGTYSK